MPMLIDTDLRDPSPPLPGDKRSAPRSPHAPTNSAVAAG